MHIHLVTEHVHTLSHLVSGCTRRLLKKWKEENSLPKRKKKCNFLDKPFITLGLGSTGCISISPYWGLGKYRPVFPLPWVIKASYTEQMLMSAYVMLSQYGPRWAQLTKLGICPTKGQANMTRCTVYTKGHMSRQNRPISARAKYLLYLFLFVFKMLTSKIFMNEWKVRHC